MSFIETLIGFAGRLKIGDVTVDASVSEVHNLDADVTEHPVEQGSDAADHYRAKQRTLQIDGVVSSTPIETGFPGQTLVSSIGRIIKDDDPVKNAWSVFKDYFDQAEVITVSTSLDEYPSVVLTNLAATRDVKTGQILRFTCSIKQLRFVTTEEAAAIEIPKTTTAGKKKAKGKKPTTEATETQNQSAAAKLLDKGLSFF
jgi:hypothetical protein